MMNTALDLTQEYLKGYLVLVDYINRNVKRYFGKAVFVEDSAYPTSNPSMILALKYHLDDNDSVTFMINPDTDNKSQMRLIVFHNLSKIMNKPILRSGNNPKNVFHAELIELEKMIVQSLIVVYDRIHGGHGHSVAA